MSIKPPTINGAARPEPNADVNAPTQAAATSPSGAPQAALPAAPSARSRAMLGETPVKQGRLMLNDPRAKAAVAASLQHLHSLGMSDASLRVKSVEIDELGMSHVRFERMINKVQVFAEETIVGLKGGKVSSVMGNTAPSIVVTKSAGKAGDAFSAKKALDAALKAFGGEPEGKPVVDHVVFKDAQGIYHEGYHVQLVSLALPNPRRMSYLIDGSSIGVVGEWNSIGGVWLPRSLDPRHSSGATPIPPGTPPHPVDVEAKPTPGPTPAPTPTPKAVGDDTTLYSGKVDIKTTKGSDGQYIMLDSMRGDGVHTVDAQNRQQADKAVEIKDNNDVWGEKRDSARQKGAVDAQFGMEQTYDMFKNMLGVNSFDLQGGKMVGNVHVGTNYVNAYWDGETMNYGDGDGTTASALTTLDVTGHEITHGLIEHTANLVYSGESGGLNEAFADIGGFLTEYYAATKESGRTWDWRIGEDCWTPNDGDPNDALRYMDEPTKDKYSIDNYKNYPKQKEVHGSSGIAANFFYQLAEEKNEGKKKNSVSGVAVKDGIGVERAAKIVFRALRTYMTPSCTFAQARQATIQAAIDLYGADSVEVKKTKEAWSAVGVEDAPKIS